MNKLLGLGIILVVVATEGMVTEPQAGDTAAAAAAGASCPIPYVSVSGRCVFFDPLETGTWQEVRAFCEQLQGHLIKVDPANFMTDVVTYIHDHEIGNTDFWNGANDVEVEGEWRWHDGTLVTMGTPFWGYVAATPIIQEPAAGTAANCGCMLHNYLYFFHDCDCEAQRSPICELNTSYNESLIQVDSRLTRPHGHTLIP